MKVNLQFQFGVWRKAFVDRDLNVFCICYSLLLLQEWVIKPRSNNQSRGPGDHNLSGSYPST